MAGEESLLLFDSHSVSASPPSADQWDPIWIYLTNILPQWPIFKPEEVIAMQRRGASCDATQNDQLSLLVMEDLAKANPLNAQVIMQIQFSGIYQQDLRIYALLGLYWIFFGHHSLANECITKAFIW